MNQNIKHDLWAGLTGLIFGFGLILSDMISPARVRGFLDIFGAWDASLLFVMVGGIAVTFLGFGATRKKARPFFAEVFHWPAKKDIDNRLIAGATIFGIGWGIVGICPGPAFAGFIASPSKLAVFLCSMLICGYTTILITKK